MLCFAFGCNHRPDRDSCSFYRFPKNETLRKLWIAMCRRADRAPTYISRLCSCHFEDGKKENNPTIFTYSSSKEGVRKDTLSDMVVCCVPLCNSHGGQKNSEDGTLITFHELPTDSERRELWLKAIKNQEGIPIKFWEPIEKADKSLICNLHFRRKDFVPNVKFRCLMPDAVPSIFPSYKNRERRIIKRKNTEAEKEDVPVSKIPCKEPIAAENSSNNEQNLVKDSSDITPENTSSSKKDIPSKKKSFSFKKLHKTLSFVQKPNQYWGVTPTDKFIIFSRWNEEYIPEKRVVIEQNLNVKVFLGELEINTMNLMEFDSSDDVSNLLDKVDSINYSGKSLEIKDIN